MKTAIATIFILVICATLSTAQNLHVAVTPPPLPVPSSSTDPCDSLKKNCLKNAGSFAGLLRPVEACKPLRSCKKVCRQEKRGDMRGCRKVKRSCKDVCRSVSGGKSRRRCKRDCRKTKRRCAREARKTKRVCRDDCRSTYKTDACKNARRKILTSGLKTVYHCAAFALCIANNQ